MEKTCCVKEEKTAQNMLTELDLCTFKGTIFLFVISTLVRFYFLANKEA